MSLNNSYRDVFSGPAGQEVLKDLWQFCGGARLSYNRTTNEETAFNEGMRNVLYRILQLSGKLKQIEEVL